MKQFIYSSDVVNLPEWPSGTLRLEGIEITNDPNAADIFVCPGSLEFFREPSDLNKLTYLKGYEAQHVLFDVSDHDTQYHQACMFIRCNLRQFNIDADPNSINFAWPVESYDSCVEVPEGGFKYDLSFQGWSTSSLPREQAPQACLDTARLKTNIAMYSDFCGYLHDRATNQWTAEGLRRRSEFRRSMKESRIALCPESIAGVFPYRFFEAMSAGRIPLLVSSGYILPFQDEIPYRDFIIELPAADASRAGDVALDYVRSHSDAQIIDRGLEARHYWSKWLDCRLWPKTMAHAVRSQLEKRAVCA